MTGEKFPVHFDARSFNAVAAFRRKCLDCGVSLDKGWRVAELDAVVCHCGIRYSAELVRNSNPVQWELIRSHRAFTRDGEVVIVPAFSDDFNGDTSATG